MCQPVKSFNRPRTCVGILSFGYQMWVVLMLTSPLLMYLNAWNFEWRFCNLRDFVANLCYTLLICIGADDKSQPELLQCGQMRRMCGRISCRNRLVLCAPVYI